MTKLGENGLYSLRIVQMGEEGCWRGKEEFSTNFFRPGGRLHGTN